jgi:hypothetical protein
MCQFSDCHTGTLTNLRITITTESKVLMMNPIVIPTGTCLTNLTQFCQFLKGCSGILTLVLIQNLTKNPGMISEIDAFRGVSLDSSHWCFGDERVQYKGNLMPGQVLMCHLRNWYT